MTKPGAEANSAWHMLALHEHALELTKIYEEWDRVGREGLWGKLDA